MKILKNKLLLAVIIALTMIVTAIPVFATNDNYGYAFYLDNKGGNTYSAGHYRQTTDLYNKWKVNMKACSDSDGLATYWIARTGDKAQVSDPHNIHSGTGEHYYPAKSGASKATVSLGADNDDMRACTVSGVWDEETN